jgi:predicted amidohydrolase YtcJ
MQTLWAYADSYITDLTEPFIGPERSRWLYPNGALRDAGAFLVSGSDWPVSTSDPFDAIETAVLRMDSDGGDKPWLPEHLLTVIDMLRALTINGAILTGEDAERGSIESGKRADLIVIDADLLTIDPADISEIAVVTTYLDGRTVYTRGIDEDRTP